MLCPAHNTSWRPASLFASGEVLALDPLVGTFRRTECCLVVRGVWLRVAKQFLSCALVRGRGVVFRHYYKSIAKCAGKDYRDGAVVPFERVWMLCVLCLIVLWGFPLLLLIRVSRARSCNETQCHVVEEEQTMRSEDNHQKSY